MLGYVLADSIAAEFGWQILERFFQRTVYSELEVHEDAQGRSLWRGSTRLTPSAPDSQDMLRRDIHARVGWTVFLQELWHR